MIGKWGKCSTADEESGTITATFEDQEGFVTGDLPMVYPPGLGNKNLPKPGDEVFVIMFGRTEGVCLGVSSEYVK